VEREPACCDIIKGNLEKTGLSESAHVYCTSVGKALSFLDKEYDIVLVDPPYSDPSIDKVILQLAESRLIGKDTVVIVTHSSRLPLEPAYDGLHMLKEHRHGDSTIAIFRKETMA
jgi:16S rRNA G966 N2-methylase RsmD